MSAAAEPTEEVFCDTSVLLDYVLDQGNQGATKLLISSPHAKVISEKVEEEFEKVPERREEIYLDFLEIIGSDEAMISEAKVNERDYLKPNDKRFFQTLRDSISEADTKEQKLKILREKQKYIDRRYGQVEEIIEEVYSRNDEMGLVFRIARIVDNEDDCQVICDAVQWARQEEESKFATLDVRDIVDNEERINDAIDEYHGDPDLLNIGKPKNFVE